MQTWWKSKKLKNIVVQFVCIFLTNISEFILWRSQALMQSIKENRIRPLLTVNVAIWEDWLAGKNAEKPFLLSLNCFRVCCAVRQTLEGSLAGERPLVALCESSLGLHVLGVSSQCVGPGFNPWSGNQIPHAATKTWHSRIDKQILRGENGELSSSYTLSRTLVVCARRHHFSVRETFPSSVSHQGRFSIEFVFRFCSNSRHLWAWKFLVDDKTLEKSLE